MAKKKLSAKPNKTAVKKTFAWKYYFLVVIAILFLSINFINPKNETEKTECANSESCISDLSGKYEVDAKTGYFLNQKINVPEIAKSNEKKAVLGDSNSNKHIYIDLSAQRLYAKEGDNIIYEFLISSGKWGKTPTGDFTTWIKLKSTKMSGGNKDLGTYYYLPNVPYTMYFYNESIPKSRGFGIHGAYWHNNFGTPMSHGCINMNPEEAKLLYIWANPQSGENSVKITPENPGTPITIYGTAPLN